MASDVALRPVTGKESIMDYAKQWLYTVITLVLPARLELAAFPLSAERSNQLSYGRMWPSRLESNQLH